MKETHFDGSRSGRNFTLDRQVEPLVMDSEISGLEDKHAFLKIGNSVARFHFEYMDVPKPPPPSFRAKSKTTSWASTRTPSRHMGYVRRLG